ncbi:hypothetical protein CGCS363_v011653 [Colletotrichum siamense]|uniref:uncharacterized protein n=1 Tax=Colletotrichum siamense TaxID=690259 RepID=UPI0018726DFF|nr:uncharacterized protein CGCS363_v011653 [Colletotrichum siamense]KAF5489224.1 hypothetical protein CGCS363_v011653 [Colletotrichum siamense]
MDRSNKSPPPLPVNPSWAQADYYTESKTWCGPAQTSPGEKARPDTGPGVGSLSLSVSAALSILHRHRVESATVSLCLSTGEDGTYRETGSITLIIIIHHHLFCILFTFTLKPSPSVSVTGPRFPPPTHRRCCTGLASKTRPTGAGALVGAAIAVGLSIGSLPPSAPTSS